MGIIYLPSFMTLQTNAHCHVSMCALEYKDGILSIIRWNYIQLVPVTTNYLPLSHFIDSLTIQKVFYKNTHWVRCMFIFLCSN